MARQGEVGAAEAVSLRQWKKEKLRGALIATAQRLFRAVGYEATTLNDICRENAIHTRTLLRYFGSKEDLALAPARDGYERFLALLPQARGREGVIGCWRAYVQDYWFGHGADAAEAFEYLRMLTSVTPLRALVVDLDRRFEDAIGRALAREDGVDEDTDVYSQILAANLVSAPRNVALRRMRQGQLSSVIAHMLAVIDLVTANFPDRPKMMRDWRPPGRQPMK